MDTVYTVNISSIFIMNIQVHPVVTGSSVHVVKDSGRDKSKKVIKTDSIVFILSYEENNSPVSIKQLLSNRCSEFFSINSKGTD